MSQELTVNAVIHFGRNFHLHSNLAFPRGKPSMGTFNEKNSYADFQMPMKFLQLVELSRELLGMRQDR